MALRDLFVEIGVDVDDNPLKDLDSLVDEVQNAFDKLDAGGLDDIESDVRNATREFDDLSKEIRNTDREVEKLDNNDLKKLEKETENAASGFEGLKKTVAGVFAAIATYVAVDKIVDFGVDAIEAAANFQALNAQFEQVFGDMQVEAQKTIEELGEEFGMLPTRLQAPFTTMTSMFKGLGYETKEAAQMAADGVTLVADAAAFYDMSFEDANSAFNSFIKGNYEGGERIGLFANETQMAAFAASELGMEWKNLDEAGKQLVRLQYAQSMQELAGATGQAARESDQYENVLGNLRQAWQDFLVKAGTPLLEHAVTVLQWLGDVLANIDPGPFFEWIAKSFEGIMWFKNAILDLIGSIKSVSDISEVLQGIGVPPEIADAFQRYGETIFSVFETGKSAIFSFVEEVVIPLMPKAQEYVGTAINYISNIVSGMMNIFSIAGSIVKGLIEKVIVPLFPVAQEVISTAIDVISPVLRVVGSLFKAITEVIKFLVEEVIVPLLPIAANNIKQAWTVMKPILEAIKKAFEAIADTVEWVIDMLGTAGEAIKNFKVGEKISGAVSWIGSKIPGFEVGLGRVPYDDMPALLHKDEAVLPAEEAETLRNAGILIGDGTGPKLDLSGTQNSTTYTTTSNASVNASVNIIVQDSDNPQETGKSIKEQLEEFFADLNIIIPTPREG